MLIYCYRINDEVKIDLPTESTVSFSNEWPYLTFSELFSTICNLRTQTNFTAIVSIAQTEKPPSRVPYFPLSQIFRCLRVVLIQMSDISSDEELREPSRQPAMIKFWWEFSDAELEDGEKKGILKNKANTEDPNANVQSKKYVSFARPLSTSREIPGRDSKKKTNTGMILYFNSIIKLSSFS